MEVPMANIESDKKSILTSKKHNIQNASFKSSLKSAIKAVEAAPSKEEGEKALLLANAKLDKACSKNIVKKNYVSNQKSRLAKHVNSLA